MMESTKIFDTPEYLSIDYSKYENCRMKSKRIRYIDEELVYEAYLLLKAGLGESFFDLKKSPYAGLFKEFEQKLRLGDL